MTRSMRYDFMTKAGDRVAVIRPLDGDRAATRAREVLAAGGGQIDLDAILLEQPYTFVGLLSRNGKRVLDEDGWSIGQLVTGDSLFRWGALRERRLKLGDAVPLAPVSSGAQT